MSAIMMGIISLAIFLVLLIIGTPVAFSILTAGFVGLIMVLGTGPAIGFVATDLFEQVSSYPLTAILTFVLMGFYAELSGMTDRFFTTARVWVGSFRGGLGVATVFCCALFASVCGSSAATTATAGKIAYPEMKRLNYDDRLSSGSIIGGGLLGPMIPPSTGLIIYALLAEQSIAKMLVSGIIPGVILAIFLAFTVYIQCWRHPELGPRGPKTTWREKLRALPALGEAAGLFLFVIGGLFYGLFTPTQAGGAGCIGALVIGLLHRRITLKGLWSATRDGLKVSCMIFFLIAGSVVFGHFLSASTLSISFVEWAQGLPLPPMGLFLLLALFYVVAGCLVDAMGLLVITVPLIIPVFFDLGFNPVWFGLMVAILTETGVITPPVGVNLFVMKAVAPEIPLTKIYKGAMPFFAAMMLVIALLIAVPWLVTALPSLVR